MAPAMKYQTHCRVRGCTWGLAASPLDIPLVGMPDARVQAYVNALSKHMEKSHPEQMQRLQGSMIEMMGFLVLTCFTCEDPTLANRYDATRHALHKMTRKNSAGDAELMSRAANLWALPEEERQAGLLIMLQSLRDFLSEAGEYTPKPVESSLVPA